MVIVGCHSSSSQLTGTDRRVFRVRAHKRAHDATFIDFRKQVTEPEEVTENILRLTFKLVLLLFGVTFCAARSCNRLFAPYFALIDILSF